MTTEQQALLGKAVEAVERLGLEATGLLRANVETEAVIAALRLKGELGGRDGWETPGRLLDEITSTFAKPATTSNAMWAKSLFGKK